MAKPIFLVGFPYAADLSSIGQVQSSLNHLLGEEYHVLVYKTSRVDDVSFEVLNAINATDVEINELISRVREEIAETFQKIASDAHS